jgi:hypothetical protein
MDSIKLKLNKSLIDVRYSINRAKHMRSNSARLAWLKQAEEYLRAADFWLGMFTADFERMI